MRIRFFTTFSHRLSIQLAAKGLNPHPFPLDDYYKNRDICPRDENGELDLECLDALDVELFNHDMNELLAGKTVNLPIFNFKTGKREYKDKLMTLGKDDVLVIEGIHGLNDKLSYSLPIESKFKIYIIAFFVIFFWAAYEQAGASLTFFAELTDGTKVNMEFTLPVSFKPEK